MRPVLTPGKFRRTLRVRRSRCPLDYRRKGAFGVSRQRPCFFMALARIPVDGSLYVLVLVNCLRRLIRWFKKRANPITEIARRNTFVMDIDLLKEFVLIIFLFKVMRFLDRI